MDNIQNNGSEGFSIESQNIRILEALLFASEDPIEETVLQQQLKVSPLELSNLLDQLNMIYSMRGIQLCNIAGGWAFRTAPDLAEELTIFRKVKRRLSRAATETLAIIAYHQPITRAEIEEIRGVAVSRGTLDLLLEADWVKPRGRRRSPGRPSTWVTTGEFLNHFGLSGLDDLPDKEELSKAGFSDLQSDLPGMVLADNNLEDTSEVDESTLEKHHE